MTPPRPLVVVSLFGPSGLLRERLPDPAVRQDTSTPKADPSGDYAFEFFALAERRTPGAQAALCAKALQLVGGPPSSPTPA